MQDRDPDTARYLASLPEPPLPDRLRERVGQARSRRLRRRVAGVSVAMLGALGLALTLPGALTPDGPGDPLLAPAPLHPLPGDATDRLRTVQAIDRALQAAYDREAGDDELEPLWRARAAVVGAMPAAGQQTRG